MGEPIKGKRGLYEKSWNCFARKHGKNRVDGKCGEFERACNEAGKEGLLHCITDVMEVGEALGFRVFNFSESEVLSCARKKATMGCQITKTYCIDAEWNGNRLISVIDRAHSHHVGRTRGVGKEVSFSRTRLKRAVSLAAAAAEEAAAAEAPEHTKDDVLPNLKALRDELDALSAVRSPPFDVKLPERDPKKSWLVRLFETSKVIMKDANLETKLTPGRLLVFKSAESDLWTLGRIEGPASSDEVEELTATWAAKDRKSKKKVSPDTYLKISYVAYDSSVTETVESSVDILSSAAKNLMFLLVDDVSHEELSQLTDKKFDDFFKSL